MNKIAGNSGVVYVATGQAFVDEAMVSAHSVRRHMPDLPIALFTDLERLESQPPDPFSHVYLLQHVTHSCLDKMYPLLDTPFEKTLFLDTDTYVCDRLEDVFAALDHYDIATVHPPYRVQYQLPGIPECFPEPNTGVIAYRRSSEALEVLERWPKEYQRQQASTIKPHHDQHSLRAALYGAKARHLVLPNEYNFRTIGPNFAGKGSKVKIIHGRHASFERVSRRLNKNLNYRVSLVHPLKVFSGELMTYKSAFEALSNAVFERLPKSARRFLSAQRRRFGL